MANKAVRGIVAAVLAIELAGLCPWCPDPVPGTGKALPLSNLKPDLMTTKSPVDAETATVPQPGPDIREGSISIELDWISKDS